MTGTIETRDFILEFLRRELVGPSPLPNQVQENGEEILRPQDPPKQRYGAGILFPQKSAVSSHEINAEDEQAESEADSPEPAGIVENSSDDGSEELGERASETDQEVNLANQFLPSAMGLSALVEITDGIQIEVSAATYLQGDPPVAGGGRTGRRPWLRRPIKETVHFESSELIRDGRIALERPISTVAGVASLVLHLVSRPFGVSQTTRLVTFTLVNRIQTKNQAPKNVECFYNAVFVFPPLERGDVSSTTLNVPSTLLTRKNSPFNCSIPTGGHSLSGTAVPPNGTMRWRVERQPFELR